MKWKKANLFENIGNKIFLSEYGLCTISLRAVTVNDKSIDQVFLYSSESKAYIHFVFDQSNLSECIKNVFNGDLATRKPSQAYYGYNRGASFSSAEANELKVKSLKIGLQVNYWTSLEHGQTQTEYEEVVLEKESDAGKYFCWIAENMSNDSFQVADLSKIKEGDKLYLMGVGEVLVKKINSFPNNKNSLFVVADTEGNSHDVIFGSSVVYYLPYEHIKDLIDEIDEAKNEQLLLPYVSKSKETPGVYNIYWNSIEEASRYIVSIYKIINITQGLYYHLADYDIDRNTHYFAIDKLVGGDFVFKVVAEDRNGKAIAKSRGAVNGYPKTFRN